MVISHHPAVLKDQEKMSSIMKNPWLLHSQGCINIRTDNTKHLQTVFLESLEEDERFSAFLG